MKSTGEVMGLNHNFATAFAKSQLGAGSKVPREGTVFISVRDDDKPLILDFSRHLIEAGFKIVATSGTHKYLTENGIPATKVNKVLEGRPHIVDSMKNGGVQLVINTTDGAKSISDSRDIRRTALMGKIPYYTTIPGANAAVAGIIAYREGALEVKPLQAYFASMSTPAPDIVARVERLLGWRPQRLASRLRRLHADRPLRRLRRPPHRLRQGRDHAGHRRADQPRNRCLCRTFPAASCRVSSAPIRIPTSPSSSSRTSAPPPGRRPGPITPSASSSTRWPKCTQPPALSPMATCCVVAKPVGPQSPPTRPPSFPSASSAQAWLDRTLPTLIAAEQSCRLSGDALAHFDLRSDNLCLTANGVKFIDWAEACRSSADVDLGFFLPSLAYENGPLPEAILPNRPDIAALISGFFATRAGLPNIPDAPFVRRVQREQLSTALPWAIRALGLPPASP